MILRKCEHEFYFETMTIIKKLISVNIEQQFKREDQSTIFIFVFVFLWGGG